MVKKILLLLILLIETNSYSQQIGCGVQDEDPQKELERKQLIQQLRTTAFGRSKLNAVTYIAVRMHVIGTDDNTGYLDSNNINDALAELNKQFQDINVVFYFSGTSFEKIPNSYIYNGYQTTQETNDFHAMYGVSNAVNVYATNKVFLNGSPAGGWSYITPGAQQFNMMWLVNSQTNDDKTTPHEFGHYFGLQHTFNNATSSNISDRELVTRNFNEVAPRISANCLNAGDYICDTPADPRGNGDAIVSNCLYSGLVTDANGDVFAPFVSNYMDYNWCRPYTFTEQQHQKMNGSVLLLTNPNNDYSLDAPEVIQNQPGNLTAYTTSDYSNISLSWTDTSSTETGYIIERSTSPSGPFVAIAGVQENTVVLENVETVPNVVNYFRIKPSNSKNNYSAVSNGILPSNLCANTNGQTCQLNADPTLAAWQIDQFKLLKGNQVLINNQNTGCSPNGIGNYFNTLSAPIAPGQAFNFIVKSKIGANGAAYNVDVKLFADWNLDNDFEDVGETLFSSQDTWSQATGSFVVPNNIPLGNFRLRAVLAVHGYQFDACSTNFGEIEDYKLINTTLGTQDFIDQKELLVFPNPAKNYIQIKTQEKMNGSNFTIADTSGRIVLRGDNIDGQAINVGQLANGLYILNISNGLRTKFIKE